MVQGMDRGSDNDTCCLEFDPAPWDGVSHEWSEKRFIKDSIPQILHIPLPSMYRRKLTRMWDLATAAGAAPEMKDFLFLAYDPSPWKSELYLAVTAEVPGADNVKLSGRFYSKVFDGPPNAVPKWIKEMDRYLAEQQEHAARYYFYFTTCPRCAKKYGHNYVVTLAEV